MAKRLIPGKPIRYVMNTRPHSDHTGGLPALVPALEKLGVVDFERYINVHTSAELQTKEGLRRAVGR